MSNVCSNKYCPNPFLLHLNNQKLKLLEGASGASIMTNRKNAFVQYEKEDPLML